MHYWMKQELNPSVQKKIFHLKNKWYIISYFSRRKSSYNEEGYLILTSNRLVIIPTRQNTNFKAIEIPLNQIYQEEFKQPLFGKSYLTAKCNRIPSSHLILLLLQYGWKGIVWVL